MRLRAYKIAFVDIDWTILNHNIRDWDYESLDALKAAQQRGVLVYLCTARPYDSVYHTGIFDVFNPDGVICTNGGVCFIKDKLLFANTIPEDVVREVERIANKHHLVLELATAKERHLTAKFNKYVDNYFKVFWEVVPEVKKYQNKDVSAILLFAPEKYDEKLKKELPKEIDYLRYDSHGVDLGYYRYTKGDGVKKVLKHLNINKEYAIGIGDSNDDISMFEEVGLSIAMGNGSEQAKQSAILVAPDISEHGLKVIFEQQNI